MTLIRYSYKNTTIIFKLILMLLMFIIKTVWKAIEKK